MNAPRNVDSKVVIAVLGTLAAFGYIVIGAVFFFILMGLGMNDDLAWGLSVLLWIGVVALGVVSVVYFYDSIKRRVEQVTVARTVSAPPATPAVESEYQTDQDEPPPLATPSTSYRSMLLESDGKREKPE